MSIARLLSSLLTSFFLNRTARRGARQRALLQSASCRVVFCFTLLAFTPAAQLLAIAPTSLAPLRLIRLTSIATSCPYIQTRPRKYCTSTGISRVLSLGCPFLPYTRLHWCRSILIRALPSLALRRQMLPSFKGYLRHLQHDIVSQRQMGCSYRFERHSTDRPVDTVGLQVPSAVDSLAC